MTDAIEQQGIPFTEYLLPDAQRESVWIRRPADIEALAQLVLNAGLVFEGEVLRNGMVSLTVANDEEDVEIELCANGPDVPDAVDRLVRKAAARVARGL